MALYKAVMRWYHTSGLEKDQVNNTLHVSTNEGLTDAGTASDIAGDILAAFNAATNVGASRPLLAMMSKDMSRVVAPTCDVYDIGGGSPLATETMAAVLPNASNVSSLPGEIACCLSFRGDYGALLEEAPDDADADTAPERPRSRVRNRIFFGPLTIDGAAHTTTPIRPHGDLIEALLDLATELGDMINNPNLASVEARWVTWSGIIGSSTVVQASVDNAFDVQRRRGVAPTTRTAVTISQP